MILFDTVWQYKLWSLHLHNSLGNLLIVKAVFVTTRKNTRKRRFFYRIFDVLILHRDKYNVFPYQLPIMPNNIFYGYGVAAMYIIPYICGTGA